MVQTRAPEDAKRRRSPDDQGQDSPPRKRQRPTTHPTPSKKQGKDRKRAIEDATHPTPSKKVQGKDRERAIEDACDLSPKPSSKRRQTSRPAAEDTFAEATGHREPNDPIGFWVTKGVWPRELFESNIDDMSDGNDLVQKRPFIPGALGRKRSNSALTTTTLSDVKSAQYRDPQYESQLDTVGVFMDLQSDHGITAESQTSYMALLTSEQTIPTDSLFRDDLFQGTWQSVAKRNEAKVFADISPLIVPRAEPLARYGPAVLGCLIESINEGWSNSIPLTTPRPQPDYSVGFRQQAFTNDQLLKLKPFVGNAASGDRSFFMATKYMYFPFLACEVKCGLASSGLDAADRQNAHSMALAAQGIVKLFRNVGRENEVHRQILGFSVSHDHQNVRIYGYYPVIDGKDTRCYRHRIRSYDFTDLDGKEKWTAYRFVKNVYDKWMPDHFKRICSAIDKSPVPGPKAQALSKSTGLSQVVGSQLELSEADSESLRMDKDNMPAPAKRRK